MVGSTKSDLFDEENRFRTDLWTDVKDYAITKQMDKNACEQWFQRNQPSFFERDDSLFTIETERMYNAKGQLQPICKDLNKLMEAARIFINEE